MDKRQYGGLDWGRMVAALLVVAIHTSPLATYSAEADWFLTRVLGRVAVPLFLLISGFFLLSEYLFAPTPGREAKKRLHKFCKRTACLYLAAVLLYLPLGFYAGLYQDCRLTDWLRLLLIDGTFYHLWYLPAVLTAVALLCGLRRWLSVEQLAVVALSLYGLGLLGDSYYGLAQHWALLADFYQWLFQFCAYTRNGFFLAPVFLLMGAWLGYMAQQKHWQCCDRLQLIDLLPSLLFLAAEAILLRSLNWPRHDSMYLCLLPVLYGLFQLLLQWHVRAPAVLRPLSTAVYLLHPLVIVLVRGVAKVLGLSEILVTNRVGHYLAVCLGTMLLSLLLLRLQKLFQKGWKP